MKDYIQIRLFAVIILIFCFSCDSSEPEYSQWDPDWDEHYERPTAMASQDYRYVFPTDVIWYGKRLVLSDETKAMLKAEAAEPSINPLRVTTDSYGQLKKNIGSKVLDIDELIIDGPVNGDDLTYIKRCVAMGNLRSVDLSAAQIQDNIIPQEAFLLYEYPNPENGLLWPAYLPLFRIQLPKGMKIGAFAFANSLLTEIDMPDVKSLDSRCFVNAFMLGGEVNIANDTQIGYDCFMGAGNGELAVNFDNKILHSNFFLGAGLKELNLAEGLEEIESGAISGTTLESLELPKTLKKLGESALQGNYEIKTLTLPASLESIAKYALAKLKGLEKLYVKFSDPYVAKGPRDYDELMNYDDEWSTPFGDILKIGIDKNLTPNDVKVYVPQSAMSEFKKAVVWEWFSSIVAE